MSLQSINLKPVLYHDYVEGKDVVCSSSLLQPGEHVMVFKDTIAATSSVPVPHSSQHSDSIGVEGIVTAVQHSAGQISATIRKI